MEQRTACGGAARRKGYVIVLAAAGNCVETVVWPARFAEVIAIAGINKDDKPWRGSCRGPEVAISAPAEFVPRARRNASTDPQDVVDGGQGTSFAVALTAGIAAIWLAHYGRDHLISLLKSGESLSARFRALLAATARVKEGLDTANFGAGIVDAACLSAIPNRCRLQPPIQSLSVTALYQSSP